MVNKKMIWITGSEGFVGSALVERLCKRGYTVLGTDSELSVTEPERLESFAEKTQPGIVINCAGIHREATTLDNRVKAYEVNALGARNVALAANTVGATIIQVSSDDVYGSRQVESVNEFDSPQPDTPYGKSKRAGEIMVRNSNPDHLILRASWLYHAGGGRFKALLDAAEKGEKYEARIDQFASPLSIATYTELLIHMIDNGFTGTYNLAPTGFTSRFNFAEKILEYAGYNSDEILVAVQEPATAEYVVLESLMLEMKGVELPSWEEELKSYMKEVELYKPED